MFIQLISRKWDGKLKRQRSVITNNELIFICTINCSLLHYKERKKPPKFWSQLLLLPLQKLNLISLWCFLFLPSQKLLSHTFQCSSSTPVQFGNSHSLHLKLVKQCFLFFMEYLSRILYLLYLNSTFTLFMQKKSLVENSPLH